MNVTKILLTIGNTKLLLERLDKGVIRTKVKGYREIKYSFRNSPSIDKAVKQLATAIFLSLVGTRPNNIRQPNVSRLEMRELIKTIKAVAAIA